MIIEVVKLITVITILVCGWKIMLNFSATLTLYGWKSEGSSVPKKIGIYFIFITFLLACIYLYFFSRQELIGALQFAFYVGVPIGIFFVFFYVLALKLKKEGKPIAKEKTTEDMINKLKSLPEANLPQYKEELSQLDKIFKTEYTDISWKDCLGIPLGFFVLFLVIYIFHEDFFRILVKLFMK